MYKIGDRVIWFGRQQEVIEVGKISCTVKCLITGQSTIAINKMMRFVNKDFRRLNIKVRCISNRHPKKGSCGVTLDIINDNVLKVLLDNDEIEVFYNHEVCKI